jgi:predicted  nucleic acid-binding Zn-ribbon protein
MGKRPRSFSIDEEIAELLSSNNDLNASAAVNSFLREYVASGRGEEAALEVRLEQLDEQISEQERKLTKLKRERQRIEASLDSRRKELDEELLTMEKKVQNNKFDPSNIQPENPAIQNRASNAGVSVERFVDRLEARIGD